MSDDRTPGDLDGLMGRIGEWRDDADAAASALARSRRYWLRRQAAEATTLAGVLLALGEREVPVTIGTAGGRHRGTISSVTRALCTLENQGARVLIPLAAVTTIDSGVVEINDDRTPAAATDLPAVLAGLAPERPAIVVQLSDGSEVRGALVVVGSDVVGIAAPAGDVTYTPLAAIACCVLPLT